MGWRRKLSLKGTLGPARDADQPGCRPGHGPNTGLPNTHDTVVGDPLHAARSSAGASRSNSADTERFCVTEPR